MGSVHRIVGNHRNQIREAILAATAIRPSTDIRQIASNAQGFGRFALTGPYTGPADTVVDVEITGGAGGDAQVSAPVFRGIGSGDLTVSAVNPAAPPQTITLTLADAGDPAKHARIDFFGRTLRAKQAGVSGNDIALTVVRNLTVTASAFSVLAEMPAGTAERSGPEWDFDAVASETDDIPADAPRIAFAGFPQIHRTWKTWESSEWIYRFDPVPNWAIPVDTAVQTVTGDYQITITDGTTTEVYEAVTIYDFLLEVRSRSALVEVLGIVAEDMAPGGMAVTDIPLRSDAHALPARGTLVSPLAPRIEVGTVSVSAPTENLRITCLGSGSGPANAEVWRVRGGVSGDLPRATTGQQYTSGPVPFRIPPVPLAAVESARIAYRVGLAPRTIEEGEPAICVNPLRLGAAARDKTLTFRYTQRPPPECDCSNMTAGPLSDVCLGLEAGGSDVALNPEYKSRLESLYEWRRDFIASQIEIADSCGTRIAPGDMDLADQATRIFAEALGEIYEVADARTEWDAALVQLDDDLGEIEGVLSPTLISDDWLVGQDRINPANGHVYRLEATIGQADTWGQPTGLSPLLSSPQWPTDGSTHELTMTHQIEGGSTSVGWTVKDLGAAIDLCAPSAETINNIARRYSARMDYVRTLAGIVPKSSASSDESGDGCWQDRDDSHWWVETSGEYGPAFTDTPYHSVVRNSDGVWMSSQEFGMGIVVDCPERLKVGDSVTIIINGAGNANGYREGDEWIIPLIAAGPTPLAGGAAGDATQTWAVASSETGALADYSRNPASPADYTGGPVTLKILEGGIPYVEGDRWTLAVEGGELRWRRDGGSWTTADIDAPVSLGDGLTLTAQRGISPSYVEGDLWQFRARATHGLDRLRQPVPGRAMAWDSATVTLDADLGSAQEIGALVIALHTLPAGATVTLSGGADGYTEWSEAVTVSDLIYHATERTARYLRLVIAGTPQGAAIGWWWAGVPWTPPVCSDLTLRREYGLTRGQGRNPAAVYRGRATGGNIAWDFNRGSWLEDDDLTELLSMLDHVAANGLEPVVLLPNSFKPAQAALVTLDVERVDISDWNDYQNEDVRAHGVDLPLRGVLS